MTEGEINTLIARIKEGDDHAFIDLLRHFEPIILRIAHNRASRFVSEDDYAQIGRLTLFTCAKKFTGGIFSGYAIQQIRREMVDYTREVVGRKSRGGRYAATTGAVEYDDHRVVQADTSVDEDDWIDWAKTHILPIIKEAEMKMWLKLCEGYTQREAAGSAGLKSHDIENMMRRLRLVASKVKENGGQ